ncbi:AMP-binding protein [Devosia honganensis]|uniref:AMP-binding protein n=1 Tax=Devosia honganensis TaxID=1610527 RepID=A0ABV7WXS8_9HYPH
MVHPDALAAFGGVPDTIPAALARAAAFAGSDNYLICADVRVDFRTMRRHAGNWARALTRLGVSKGDRVGLCLGNGVDWAAAFFGIGLVGAIAVPINTRLKRDEIGYVLEQAEISVLVVADRLLRIDFIALLRELAPAIDTSLPDPSLPALRHVVVVGSDVPRAAHDATALLVETARDTMPEAAVRPGDPLLIQYTSGTTAFPKGAVLTQRAMLWNAHAAGLLFGLRPGASYLSARPFFHISGSTLSLLAALQHSARLVTMVRFDPGEALLLAERERCTLFSGNDTLWLMLLNHESVGQRNLLLRGGWGAVSPSVYERIVAQLGADEIAMAYGMSEASNIAMAAWWDSAEDKKAGLMRPHAGLEVAIAGDGPGQFAPPGTRGEILVRGWNAMTGYYGMDEETAAAIDGDGWLHTGDLGQMTADGRLSFVGRLKDIVKVGGENVAAADVENVLHAHPGVKLAQVVGVPDPRLTEVVAAFVVPMPGASLAEDDIVAWCAERMAGFKVPRHVAIVDGFEAIGMTASSKVIKARLAEHARIRFGTGD